MTKSIATLAADIDAQQERLLALRKKKALLEAKLRTHENKKNRKNDTRRKILLGSYVLAIFESTPEKNISPALKQLRILENGMTLNGFLTRDEDRALFDFQPLLK